MEPDPLNKYAFLALLFPGSSGPYPSGCHRLCSNQQTPSARMDPERGVDSGVADPSVDANRGKGRRRLTVAHVPQEVVDSTQLSDADRRLAEMGYVQVLLSLILPFLIHRPTRSIMWLP